jgi:holo-[acyl-carrier protein] synthase
VAAVSGGAASVVAPAGVAALAGAAPVPGALVGLGLDSVEVGRFAGVLARRPILLAHLFTEGERAYADGLRDPVPSLAARFAVKEAVMKVLGVGLGAFGWHDVEVVRAPGGRPSLLVGGRAGALAAALGISTWQVSITHTQLMASAVVAGVA